MRKKNRNLPQTLLTHTPQSSLTLSGHGPDTSQTHGLQCTTKTPGKPCYYKLYIFITHMKWAHELMSVCTNKDNIRSTNQRCDTYLKNINLSLNLISWGIWQGFLQTLQSCLVIYIWISCYTPGNHGVNTAWLLLNVRLVLHLELYLQTRLITWRHSKGPLSAE